MQYTNVATYGSSILLRGHDGLQRVHKKVKYKPYLFVNSPKGEYKTVFGNPVEKMEFPTMRDARDFVKRYEGVSNFDFHGMSRFVYPYINDNFADMQYDSKKVNVVYLDIETVGESKGFDRDYPYKVPDTVVAITIFKNETGILLGMKDYVPGEENKDVTFIKCESEEHLLRTFVKVWKNFDPDIVSGFNSLGFDIPYLINRMEMVLGEGSSKELSPWGQIRPTQHRGRIGDPFDTYDIVGVSHLDYMEVYRKFVLEPRESYSLNYLSYIELGEKKVDYSDQGSLKELYENDPKRFFDYNIHDVRLLLRLEKKLKLMELAIFIAYSAKINFQDALASVIVWEVIIHNYLMRQKIVVPGKKQSQGASQFAGGYVKEPIKGLLDWLVSFDATSLYPHIIMLCNVSPDTLIKRVPGIDPYYLLTNDFAKPEYSMAANGCLYTKEKQGFLSVLMKEYFQKRKDFKDLAKQAKIKVENGDKSFEDEASKYDIAQHAIKILINSCFGALGNPYFMFYNLDNAEAITQTGQYIIQYIAGKLNEYLNKMLKTDKVDYVAAIDTDSVYLHLGPLVKRSGLTDTDTIINVLDKFSKDEIEPYMKACFEEMYEKLNSYDPVIHMKREAIASRGFWRAKKRYALNVWDNEGLRYHEPDIKIVGLDAIRTTVPEVSREAMTEGIRIILQEDNPALIQHVKNFREEYEKMSFVDIALPKGVNNLGKYHDPVNIYTKGTPEHVRASLQYNHLLRKHNLTTKYPSIYNGDKIKYVHLQELNPAFTNVIASPGRLPEELNLDRYIDRNKQFEKIFLNPMKNMTDTFGWDVEETNTIDDY